MWLFNLNKIIDTDKYAIDFDLLDIFSWNEKNNCWNYMKGTVCKDGYIRYCFMVNGKKINMYKHVIIARMFIDSKYDSKRFDIDHINHDRQDNSLGNLKIVSKSENNLNRGSFNGINFNFEIDIGEKIIVDEANQIYYSKTNDKFYRFIPHTNMYREMYERFYSKNCYRIKYGNNGKIFEFNATKFRKNLELASH